MESDATVKANYEALSANKTIESSWTLKQNKMFEKALTIYDKDAPDRWHSVAKAVGEKSAEEVKRHYELLLEDLRHVESEQILIPNDQVRRKHQITIDEEQR
ncbi:Protein RADIALIS-like [Quillaja saponaria]|uniref:Protein RADIALIS-like n=1 Tax=Quillaja saponaria TaxID=32244 RepID=A0AAD7QBB3_QUISA|nr:Protein RADIALIS-like [Quillaja saponaria]